MDTGRVVGAATLVAEQKFIHNAAVVSVHSLLHSIVHSGTDSMGHGGHLPPLHFYKWLSTGGGTMSRRTADKKLTKLY